METVAYFVCVALISYVIGTVNFSKMVAWHLRKKDITKLGSGNPGTMNMLRSFGFGLAFLAFLGEILKSGLVCFVFKLIFPQFDQFMYFFAGFFVMMGYNFPLWTHFKGGKGVACFVGIFLFSNLWYIAVAWFVVLFFVFLYLDYPFIISFMYIGGMSIAYTIYLWVCALPYAWIATVLIWVLVLITIWKHKGNIVRLYHGVEKRIDFRQKLKKFFCHKKGEIIIDEELVENQKPEKEIIIEHHEENEENKKDE